MIDAPVRRVGPTELCALAPGSRAHRDWVDISAEAYPILNLTTVAARDAAFAEQTALAGRQPECRLVGAYRDGVLVGGMRVYDFAMCVRGAQMFTGGIGAVCVGLEYKRLGVARDLVRGFIAEYRERGAALGVLYAFRPDFYAKLGFGYGAKLQQYRIPLAALPARGARERVRRLGRGDLDAFAAVYDRAAQRTNGLIRREPWRTELRLDNAALHTFGVFDAAGLTGYLTFEIRGADPALRNADELFVHELIYETPAALAALLAFVASQRDQFATLVMNTQDPDFHFVPADPRNGSNRNLFPPAFHETNTAGLGVMYRILDLAAFVGAAADGTPFGELDATVRIDLADAFVPANTAAYTIRFDRGRPRLLTGSLPADVDLAIEVGDLAALMMGSVRLRSLVAYGRAVLSHADWLARLDAAFDAPPPQCLTRF